MRIRWHLQKETRFPFGPSPDPDWFDPIGFPPPWPDRPWVFAVMVASANGVVAWRRSGPDDDPVRAILGRDDTRPERIADRRHMRHLRCYGDVAIGTQTLREQPRLIQTPQEPGEEAVPRSIASVWPTGCRYSLATSSIRSAAVSIPRWRSSTRRASR